MDLDCSIVISEVATGEVGEVGDSFTCLLGIGYTAGQRAYQPINYRTVRSV